MHTEDPVTLFFNWCFVCFYLFMIIFSGMTTANILDL